MSELSNSSPPSATSVDFTHPLSHEPSVPPWFDAISNQIKQLASLPPNWNSYGGKPMAPAAIKAAIQVLHTMPRKTLIPAIGPTASGGIQIEWHDKGLDLEIVASPTGRCTASALDLDTDEELEGELSAIRPQLGPFLERLS